MKQMKDILQIREERLGWIWFREKQRVLDGEKLEGETQGRVLGVGQLSIPTSKDIVH